MSHSLIAITITLVAGLLTGGKWWIGAALATGFFAGREHAQAEYRWISASPTRKRADMPWWGGFAPRAWNRESLLSDLVAPAIAASVLAAFLSGWPGFSM